MCVSERERKRKSERVREKERFKTAVSLKSLKGGVCAGLYVCEREKTHREKVHTYTHTQ